MSFAERTLRAVRLVSEGSWGEGTFEPEPVFELLKDIHKGFGRVGRVNLPESKTPR